MSAPSPSVWAQALRGGATAVSSVRQCLRHVDLVNSKVNAITEMHRDTLERLGAEIDSSAALRKGRLYGVPLLVKDTIDVRGYKTSLACPELLKGVAGAMFSTPRSRDAPLVHRMREEGAILMGKSNIPEKGMDVQTSNSIYGTTNNPWDLTRTPGGSSGGSAAAVAVGIVPLALGSDLGGSLRIPAAFCGVYSLRASPGRVPPEGHFPPIAREGPVRDSSLALGGIAESIDMLEQFCSAAFADGVKPYVAPEPLAPAGLSAYIAPAFDGLKTDTRIADTLAGPLATALQQGGARATVAGTPVGMDLKALGKAYVAFSKRYFAELGLPSEEELAAAVEVRDKARQVLDALLDTHSVLICPVSAVLPYPHNPEKGKITLMGKAGPEAVSYWQATISYVTPFTVTGHPIVTIPVGTVTVDNGVQLPVGVQVIGKRHEEEKLLAACRTIRSLLPPMPLPPTHVSTA